MTDVPDWNNSVTVTGGTIEIAGTTNVEVIGGTIDIAGGTVAVSGTTNVEVVGGTVDIGNALDATITGGTIDIASIAAGQLIEVANGPGGALTVAGTMDVADVSGPVDVQNANVQLSTTDTVLIHDQVPVPVDLPAGGAAVVCIGGGRAGSALIDSLLILVRTPRGQTAPGITRVVVYASDPEGNISATVAPIVYNATQQPRYDSSGFYQSSFTVNLPPGSWAGSQIVLYLDTGGVALVDTLTVTTYGHFATVTNPQGATAVNLAPHNKMLEHFAMATSPQILGPAAGSSMYIDTVCISNASAATSLVTLADTAPHTGSGQWFVSVGAGQTVTVKLDYLFVGSLQVSAAPTSANLYVNVAGSIYSTV